MVPHTDFLRDCTGNLAVMRGAVISTQNSGRIRGKVDFFLKKKCYKDIHFQFVIVFETRFYFVFHCVQELTIWSQEDLELAMIIVRNISNTSSQPTQKSQSNQIKTNQIKRCVTGLLHSQVAPKVTRKSSTRPPGERG